MGLFNGRGHHGSVAEGAPVLLHQDITVGAVGKEEASTHGGPLLLNIGVPGHPEGGILGQEGLDATLVPVPVED